MLKNNRIVVGLLTLSLLTFPTSNTVVYANECEDNNNINLNNELNINPITGLLIDNGYQNILTQAENIRLERIKEQESQRQLELQRIEQQKYYDSICYYNPYNISEISHISVDKCYELLKGASFQDYEVAQAFVNAEYLDRPVNAIFLIGICRTESLHGYSNLAKSNNNISSYRTPNRGNGWKQFNSFAHCIEETSNLISNYYINPEWHNYTGTNIYNIGKLYCEGDKWANDVNQVIRDTLNNK